MKLLKVDSLKEVKEKLDLYFSDSYLKSRAEGVPLRSAVDRYLAEDICSDLDIPQFTRSVVDGYAVVAKDTFGTGESSPVFLDIVGSVDMGKDCSISLRPGQGVYVPTGAMLPQGSDAVVMVEYAELLDEKTIAVYKSVAPNTNIMNCGDDFKKGQALFQQGHHITVKDIGVLAAIGKETVRVYQKPKISIISTGDEIIDIAETPKIGEVRDINSYTIAAFVEKTGAEVKLIKKVPDIADQLRGTLEEALAVSDIVLLSGGSSAGNKDMTAEIIDSIGNPGVITHGIAIKPGKPTILGVVKSDTDIGGRGIHNKLVVGLPGHPMAAVITYKIIVNEFIKKHFFHNEEESLSITAKIAENIHAGEGRETYQLVSLKSEASGTEPSGNVRNMIEMEWTAEPIHAKSGSISQLMMADGYVRISSLSEGIKANSLVRVNLFDR